MTEKILKLFRFLIPKKQEKASFSDFFHNASQKRDARINGKCREKG